MIGQSAVSWWVAGCLLVAWSEPVHAQAEHGSFYPLDAGTRWTYGVFGDQQLFMYWEIEVTDRQGDVATVRGRWISLGNEIASWELRLRDRGSEIDVEVPGEGFDTYYRFEEDEFVHRDPADVRCSDDIILTVFREVPIEVPAGAFTDCIRVAFDSRCFHEARLGENWCAGIGLVAWDDFSEAGSREWTLIRLERPAFRRGDANGDGAFDISDPIRTLSYLFLGTAEISCEDAADADDNGRLEVTDGIRSLQRLFLEQGSALPPPFDACGGDPTGDDLETCEDSGCE